MMTTLRYLLVGILLGLVISGRVAVIGGGAAGYFAAIRTAEVLRQQQPAGLNGHEVVVYEATKETLSKVLISGKVTSLIYNTIVFQYIFIISCISRWW